MKTDLFPDLPMLQRLALSAAAVGLLGTLALSTAGAADSTFGSRLDACVRQSGPQVSVSYRNVLGARVPMIHFRLLQWCFWQTYFQDRESWWNQYFPGSSSSSRWSSSASSISSGMSSSISSWSSSVMTSASSVSSLSSSMASSASSGASQSSVSSGGSSSVSSVSVSIKNYWFNPNRISVKKGTTVVWRNDEPNRIPHTVTRTGGQNGPASPVMWPGQTYSYTFTGTGTYNYSCQIHPTMTGSVVVTP